jgi:hypothetical protein
MRIVAALGGNALLKRGGLVAAAEDAQHVGPADDAVQPPVAVDDREPLEPGRRIRLSGMVGIGADGRPAMVNPAYDLPG